MSKENHPNFHAVKFATDVVSSYFESLRIHKNRIDIITDENIRALILEFVSEIEDMIDRCAGSNT